MAKFKQKRPGPEPKQKAMTIFLAIIMVTSIFGILFYGFNSGSDEVRDAGMEFQQTETGWYTIINKQRVNVFYLPSEIPDDIQLDQTITNRLANTKMFFVTNDPGAVYAQEMSVVSYTLSPVLWNLREIYLQPAFTEETDYDLPVVACENATLAVPVILLSSGDAVNITLVEDCIIFTGASREHFLMFRDSLLYALLGVR